MNKVIYFVGGVVVGSAATLLFMKKRMEKQIEEEVESVKEQYKNYKVIERVPVDSIPYKPSEKELADKNAKMKEDILKSANISDSNGYSSIATGREQRQKVAYNLFSNPPNGKDIHNGIDEGEDLEVYTDDDGVEEISYPKEGLSDIPYTISGDQFVNENPYFDKITLEYFDDGILSDAISGDIIEDIDRAVGRESLTKFGEYEEDVVYVRNEKTSTEYEIIRQHRPFAIIPGEDD